MLCEDLRLLYWQLSPKVAMCDPNPAQLGSFVGSWFYHHHPLAKNSVPFHLSGDRSASHCYGPHWVPPKTCCAVGGCEELDLAP